MRGDHAVELPAAMITHARPARHFRRAAHGAQARHPDPFARLAVLAERQGAQGVFSVVTGSAAEIGGR